MKKIFTAIIGLSTLYNIHAQNVGINPTGNVPNSSAGLDIDFSNKGLLIPRIALASATDAATIPSPATSLLVYNTGTGGLTPAGYYYNAGTPGSPNWVRLMPATGVPTFCGGITANYVQKWTGTQLCNSIIYDNGTNVGINTSTPNNNAQLHVSATNKGVMFPKVSLTGATDNVTIPVSSPTDDGLMVYNTSTAGTGANAITPGYYYWQSGRWTKFQTNGYAGVIFGTINPSTPNHMTTLSPSYQYTGSYIDLPPGKWVVYVYLLLSPYNPSGNSNTWDVTGTVAIWSRNTLSDSNISFAISGDIIGSPFCSGVLPNPSNYGMATGAIYIKNSTSGIKRYYLWGNIDKFGSFTNCGLFNFAANYWGENQFFAVPAE